MKSTVKKKYPAYFYAILFSIPIMIILLTEIGLRIFDYGIDYKQWIETGNGKLMLNPAVGQRYFFNSEFVPYAARDAFDKDKAANSYRVFIMGGSSAAGFPFAPAGTFAKYFEKRLRLLYPDKKIEVINLAMTAVNSYTILDLLPGVLEQKPDLILVYAGHNEYYGALGAGSSQNIGNSRWWIQLSLKLNRFKTVEMLRELIFEISSIFFSKEDPTGTMMSRMVREKSIPLNSDIYRDGVNQFGENLSEIADIAIENNVPLIVGTLISNIKDQKPFVSVETAGFPYASDLFDKGNGLLLENRLAEADSLLILAKDLDALRFRAPSEFNRIIKGLPAGEGIIQIDIEKEFYEYTGGFPIGNELMTDHLHPNLRGYMLMGKSFFDAALQNSLFPATAVNITPPDQHTLVMSRMKFTALDSIIAEQKITILKSDWPFREKPLSNSEKIALLNLNDYTDSLAMRSGRGDMTWAEAHVNLAEWHLRRNELDRAIAEIEVLIDYSPEVYQYYEFVYKALLGQNEFTRAFPYLMKKHELSPDDYSSKWIGNILLSQNSPEEAIKYLSESLKYNSNDAQVYYNLAGAYSMLKQYQNAYSMVSRAVELNPNYTAARNLKSQLENLLRSSN